MTQRGNIFLLTLLPLLVSSLIFLSAFTLLLRSWRSSHQICRDGLLQIQKNIHTTVEKLIRMNPEAQFLRWERRQAHELLKQAKDPISAAAATANLVRVIIKQKKFRAHQELMKQKTLATSRVDLQLMKEKLLLPPIEATYVSTSTPRLSLRLFPPWDLTPDHERAFGFSQKQQLTVQWSFPALGTQFQWLRRLLSSLPHLKGQCSATIIEKESLWQPSLSKGNFSLNY
ncbi:MAG: hypothetical protein AB7F59_08145 [Bdellovibrionales bacterium]